jgi:putative Holliday junction resolvase
MARVLGVDYGEKRIGLAVSDPEGLIATPLGVQDVTSRKDAVDAVRRAAGENGAERIVVGLPLNMDGSAGPMAEKVQVFVERLRTRIGLPVDTWDERLSTRLVERTLIEADVSRRKRKGLRDKLAAGVILQGYLDAAVQDHDRV